MSGIVVLTQALEGSDSMARELEAAGFHVERWPMTRLSPVPLNDIEPVLRSLADHDWIFLPSPSAVRLVAGLMKQLEVGWPPDSRAGLVGPASVDAFRDCFGDQPMVDTPAQPPHDASHLVTGLAGAGQGDRTIRRALVLNRPDGRTEWIDALRDKAGSVTVASAYTAESATEAPSPALIWQMQRAQRGGGGLAWVVGAASQVDSLLQCLPQELAGWARQQPMLVPHEAIRQHAVEQGFDHAGVYGDRRDLVERLQYLSSDHPTEHAPPAVPASNEGRSVLSLDQQKGSASPVAGTSEEKATSAGLTGEPRPSVPVPPPIAPPASPPPRPAGNPPPPPGRASSRRSGGIWALLLLLLVGALAVAGWWYTQQRFLAADRDGARRVQEAEARTASLEAQIKTLRDSQNQLVTRSATLESKLAESATQQEQLTSLYDEIAKTRGDGTLAEVEQSVTMASQHLELNGNVHAALLALQNAEQRLGNTDQSQAIGARRLILQDIERLKALPEVDLTRLAARLDDVINRVDRLPLLADANEPATAAPAAAVPSAPVATAATEATGPTDSARTTDAHPDVSVPQESRRSALERIYAWFVHGGARSLSAVRDEFRSLVTIRRIDRPDTLLLSPEQKRVARENLKLLLLNARLNLLSRHESLFRVDIGRAIDAVQRLTDTDQHDVKTAIATLQSLQSQPIELNLPSLSESLAAVRAARAASEKRS